VQAIEAREQEARRTVWSKEVLAQECGRTIDLLWDDVNAATNRLLALAGFAVGKVTLANWSVLRPLRHGIVLREPTGPDWVLAAPQWKRWLEDWSNLGWDLGEFEIRHERFETDSLGRPLASGFYLAAHLTHAAREERVVVEGRLGVQWKSETLETGPAAVEAIDATKLTLKSRQSTVPFVEVFQDRIEPPEHAYSVDPLLVYDLEGDGVSEIILAPRNRVYRRQSSGSYEGGTLCAQAPGTLFTAVLAEFDGDGAVDFLCATIKGLMLFPGSAQGSFDRSGEAVWSPAAGWEYPMAMTAGDVDGDGDLDVFVAQYRVPYEGDTLPTPYYDAADGYPAFLLRNDGSGRFTEATEAAGLAPKRARRSYSASLVDLNGDGALDLAVVSDFAGLDLYQNNGQGHFTDRTQDWVRDPRAFGMSHTVADFNADGRLDLLMLGMPSATVDRLEHLGLWRTEDPTERAMRSRMSWGNRLYLAQAGGGFEETGFGATLARSGWSWGAGALDFENDGWVDVCVVNGMESRMSVRDYESEYWLHDQFVSGGREDHAVHLYFQGKFGRTRGQGQSYGGYERNRMFLNQEGRFFLEAGHLLGVGLQEDGRNVVATDVDRDGRVDLILTGYERWPDPRLTLRVYENRVVDAGHWIGFRLREEQPGRSPIGAQIEVQAGPRRWIGHLATGDSYRVQRPTELHFGLGAVDRVDRAIVRWPSGRRLELVAPEIDRYHRVTAPGSAAEPAAPSISGRG
jgi:hypothetical protein